MLGEEIITEVPIHIIYCGEHLILKVKVQLEVTI